ncbi:AAA family ATPase [Brucella sp. JSBI001]|uniref:AAA family ATPase n=1 Tax=Brucella sp. JSBI001 TaxID=2886044 RepID=UPI00222EAB80|nr:AAA family ATPase [Brucella sp. JSBI001]UZD68531.1 AAA family ATPase [Brucella sp. JSBI001]
MISFFALKRLQVLQGSHIAYDECFHRGVNIIRGENSSGKSTIADFIFYGLGGEFDRWKDAAKRCSSVRLEIETAQSILTVHRNIGNKLEPVYIYYGDINNAVNQGIDQWQRVQIRRSAGGTGLSYTQILFRAAFIPEAQGEGASNVTLHQILRLLYADQQTPAGKLFRFETFDTRDIRDAVGQLLIGINGYEAYDARLKLRELKNEYSEKDRLYEAAQMSLPQSDGISSVSALDELLTKLLLEKEQVLFDIAQVDTIVGDDQAKTFIAERRALHEKVQRLSQKLNNKERALHENNSEQEEIASFVKYLEEQLSVLNAVDDASTLIGNIEFQYCPACLKPLKDTRSGFCILCHEENSSEEERSKYFELKIDNELQIRESRQLLKLKSSQAILLQAEIRSLRKDYSDTLLDFSTRYDVSNSPRESFLAERNRRLGKIEHELSYFERIRATIERIDALSEERSNLNKEIGELQNRLQRLEHSASVRQNKAMGLIASLGKKILSRDLSREDTFEDPTSFTIDFGDDAMLVDGKMNFAESSNVILKNTSILSILFGATYDESFWHPKFLLMDNIEDKGMEPERSHNYQRVIVGESDKAKFPHQIILTTSIVDPELDKSNLTVGEKYSKSNKTLKLI